LFPSELIVHVNDLCVSSRYRLVNCLVVVFHRVVGAKSRPGQVTTSVNF